jgi:metal-sulfur cluster biosynthetic enzyme
MSSPRTSAEHELAVWDALQSVVDPELGFSLVDLDMIRSVAVVDDRVVIELALTTPGCPLGDVLVETVCAAARNATGLAEITVHLVDTQEEQLLTAPWRAWLAAGDEHISEDAGQETGS